MGLHETVKQAREAYTRFAGSADRAEQAAARMEEHERRASAVLDAVERLASEAHWTRPTPLTERMRDNRRVLAEVTDAQHATLAVAADASKAAASAAVYFFSLLP